MRIILCIISIVCALQSGAQQEILYTQYMFNALAFNPAYAGHKDVPDINLTYRNQWTQLEGAPRTLLLSLEKGFPKKRIGLGIHIVRDQLGVQKQTSPFLSVSYRIPVSPKTTLSAGIAMGFSQYQLDGTRLQTASGFDPAIASKLNSTILADAKFGIYLNNDRFYFGVSASNLFNNNVNYSGDQNNIIVPQRLHYFVMAGYLFPVRHSVLCYTSLLIRENFNQPTSADINTLFIFNDMLGIGVCFRSAVPVFNKSTLQKDLMQRTAGAAMLQLYTSHELRIGYSYDFNIGGSNSYFGGSHEISLGLSLGPASSGDKKNPKRRYF